MSLFNTLLIGCWNSLVLIQSTKSTIGSGYSGGCLNISNDILLANTTIMIKEQGYAGK